MSLRRVSKRPRPQAGEGLEGMSRIVPLSRLRERGGGEVKPSDIAAERPKEVPPNGKRIARRVKDSSQLSNTRRSTP